MSKLITNYELTITNGEGELQIWNYELRMGEGELQIGNYELRMRKVNYKLGITNYE